MTLEQIANKLEELAIEHSNNNKPSKDEAIGYLESYLGYSDSVDFFPEEIQNQDLDGLIFDKFIDQHKDVVTNAVISEGDISPEDVEYQDLKDWLIDIGYNDGPWYNSELESLASESIYDAMYEAAASIGIENLDEYDREESDILIINELRDAPWDEAGKRIRETEWYKG